MFPNLLKRASSRKSKTRKDHLCGTKFNLIYRNSLYINEPVVRLAIANVLSNLQLISLHY